jgi:aminoglycoside 6'-N-acetyltransferase I
MRWTVREMGPADRAAWARMRAALWPDETAAAHAKGIDAVLGNPAMWGFIAEGADGGPIGFAELAIRPFANGCDAQPVPFVEGIWVDPQLRRQGVGARLIAHVEAFVSARGFGEIGSDTQLDNRPSQAAHRGWGFSETERVVYFRKRLTASGSGCG